jgi:hypothetical protein
MVKSDCDKVRGLTVKLWCIYHLVSIILYYIYWHPTIVWVLCIDCILVLTVASSLLVMYLAICRWLHYLHFLCWCCTLLTPSCFFLFHSQATCLCVFHFFYHNWSHAGYALVVISTASIKWKWRSYRRELQWSKWKGNAYRKCNRKKSSEKYGNCANNTDYYECLCVKLALRIMQ